MKMAKDIGLMAMGAGAVLAYQKYQEPVKKYMDQMMKQVDNASKNLEDMI